MKENMWEYEYQDKAIIPVGKSSKWAESLKQLAARVGFGSGLRHLICSQCVNSYYSQRRPTQYSH